MKNIDSLLSARYDGMKKDELGNGLYICQDTDKFRFGIDAVLLADFAASRIKDNSTVYDLCCGNGIVALLLYSRNNTLKITGVEIQQEVAELADYNVGFNKLGKNITILNEDIRSLARTLNGTLSYITVNPPYIPVSGGAANEDEAVSAARHEIYASLSETAANVSRLLRDKGQVFMIHRAQRLGEIITVFEKYNLKVKLLRFVHPGVKKDSNLVLIAAMKNSGDFTRVLPPLIIYGEDNCYTQEIIEIYSKHQKA